MLFILFILILCYNDLLELFSNIRNFNIMNGATLIAQELIWLFTTSFIFKSSFRLLFLTFLLFFFINFSKFYFNSLCDQILESFPLSALPRKMPLWKEMISLINEMIEDEKVITPVPTPPPPLTSSLPLSSPAATSVPTPSSSSSSFSSSYSTPTPPVILPVNTSNVTALAVKTVYREEPEPDSEFILVTAKVKAVPQKSVIKPVINNKKQKNNGNKIGNGKENVNFLGKENKNKIIDKKSGKKVSDPVPVPAPVLVPAVSTVVKASTLQQSTYVFSPMTSVTPDNYMRELFVAFQNKMSANRSNSNGNSIKNDYNNYSNNNYNEYNDNSNSNSSSNSSSSSIYRTDSSNSVRASSSDPVQFAAEVAASGVKTTVIGTQLSLLFYAFYVFYILHILPYCVILILFLIKSASFPLLSYCAILHRISFDFFAQLICYVTS